MLIIITNTYMIFMKKKIMTLVLIKKLYIEAYKSIV